MTTEEKKKKLEYFRKQYELLKKQQIEISSEINQLESDLGPELREEAMKNVGRCFVEILYDDDDAGPASYYKIIDVPDYPNSEYDYDPSGFERYKTLWFSNGIGTDFGTIITHDDVYLSRLLNQNDYREITPEEFQKYLETCFKEMQNV